LVSGAMDLRRISIVKRKDYPEVDKLEESFEVCDEGEICIAIGGDGTFLEAAKEFDLPILHIRGGERDSLGFHADVDLGDVDEVVEELKDNRYSIEEYSKLRIACKNRFYDAINDAVLFRAKNRSVHCKVYYYDGGGDKTPLYPNDLKGDGVIFSRQIGSTAYNFSAHGPIIYGVDVLAITPISANFRFSIVSDGAFSVEVTKNVASLQCDGVEIDRLSRGEAFTVNRSDRVVKVVKLKKTESLSEKLARLRKF
jgi:NAD+ kinase